MMMTTQKMIEQLPEPSTVEEMLIYNFLVGKEVYPTSPLKVKDRYLQALLSHLADKSKQAPPTKKKVAKSEV